jgi:hypothetical protein
LSLLPSLDVVLPLVPSRRLFMCISSEHTRRCLDSNSTDCIDAIFLKQKRQIPACVFLCLRSCELAVLISGLCSFSSSILTLGDRCVNFLYIRFTCRQLMTCMPPLADCTSNLPALTHCSHVCCELLSVSAVFLDY